MLHHQRLRKPCYLTTLSGNFSVPHTDSCIDFLWSVYTPGLLLARVWLLSTWLLLLASRLWALKGPTGVYLQGSRLPAHACWPARGFFCGLSSWPSGSRSHCSCVCLCKYWQTHSSVRASSIIKDVYTVLCVYICTCGQGIFLPCDWLLNMDPLYSTLLSVSTVDCPPLSCKRDAGDNSVIPWVSKFSHLVPAHYSVPIGVFTPFIQCLILS